MKRVLMSLVIGMAVFQWGGGSASGAFSDGYRYRRLITINRTKVSGTSNHSDFPVLVSGTYTYLTSIANGGKVETPNGYDICFGTVSGTQLAHEMEYWSATTGELCAWVKIPTLSISADTDIYMYYGNPGATLPAANSTYGSQAVWSSNFQAVWHLQSNGNDSSANGYHLTVNGSPTNTAVKISKGYTNNATMGNYLKVTGANNLNIAGNQTWTAWIRYNVSNTPVGAVAGAYSGNPVGFIAQDLGGYKMWFNLNGLSTPYSGATQDNNLNYCAGRYNGSTLDNFVNKSKNSVGSSGSVSSMSGQITLFQLGNNNWSLNGSLDEVRIANVARSDGWLNTEYDNQNSPATFYGIGNEQIMNNPPTDPSNPAPADGVYTNNNTPLCSWSASTDADSDPITYSYTVSANPDLSGPIVNDAGTGPGTQYQNSTLSDGTYYWRVKAWDGKDYDQGPATWSFTVDTQKPVTPVIQSMYPDFASGTITKIYGTGETSTTLAFRDQNGGTIAGTTNWTGGAFTFTPDTPLDPGSSVYVTSEDAGGNTSQQSDTQIITFEAVKNIFKDTGMFRLGADGTSIRMEKDTSYEFKIAVNENKAVTVKAYVRYNTAYGAAAKPRITVRGLGITGTETGESAVSGGDALNNWEQLTVTGTPASTGVVTLKVETFSTADGARGWIDDISVAQ